MNKKIIFTLTTIIIFTVFIFSGCSSKKLSKDNSLSVSNKKNVRNKKWAVPIKKAGLPNLHKVSDILYRGAQPNKQGIENLKKMGIKTIVNLRQFHSDKDKIANTGLGYEHIHFNTFHAEDEDVIRFLKIVTDKKKQPVFVHCQHGADRTGTMCAIYRIVVQNWKKKDALDEMINGGFGYHTIFKNLPVYIKKSDIDSIKKNIK